MIAHPGIETPAALLDIFDDKTLEAVDQHVGGVLLGVQDLDDLGGDAHFVQVFRTVLLIQVANHDQADRLGLVLHRLLHGRDLGLAVEDQGDHDAGEGRSRAQRNDRQAGWQDLRGDHQVPGIGVLLDDFMHFVLIDLEIGHHLFIMFFVSHAYSSRQDGSSKANHSRKYCQPRVSVKPTDL